MKTGIEKFKYLTGVCRAEWTGDGMIKAIKNDTRNILR